MADIKEATFRVPDGSIKLPSWQYIMEQIDPSLTRVNSALVSINTSLDMINTKLEGWTEEE